MLEKLPHSFAPNPDQDLPTQGAKKNIVAPEKKFFISLLVPAYNEAVIIKENLELLYEYMKSLEDEYNWEIVVVNDGSKDETGELAEDFARDKDHIQILHHYVNGGLGQALKTGFSACQGDCIITIDLDLSYAPDHIERMVRKMQQTRAKIVVASPYIKGGKVSNVPWLRLYLSIWANKFLSATSKGDLHTLTGMVRAYDGIFIKSINLRCMGMEVNPEIIHKARMLRAKIEEIPAHLCWHPQPKKKVKRQSSMKILKHTWAIVFFGFIFRPVMFFIIPGFILLLISIYASISTAILVFNTYQFEPHHAIALAFDVSPHLFVIGGMSLMLAVQLMSLGILSLQNKTYFEEMFYLGTAIYNSKQNNQDQNQ